ncbi:hypothetical protein [Edaphobacter modestus]|uniref:Uncharacterized protein n=1 Tax=Edaphobacter modestus TaxID=388466 RepID=A0A4Q7YY03_9BACT|nr:hypothetical protein [Edaphobacter modestus]RZU42660.1 hypothetical protein BDD14_4251 [Edaphobacter modestus]
MSLHTQMSPHIHLTHQQLCDLLIATPEETSPQLERLREHLRDCPACADEFASIRQPLARFHSATTAWAGHNAASRSWTLPPLPASFPFAPFRRRAGWLLATAALLLAAAIPFAIRDHSSSNPAHPVTAATSQPSNPIGDEALLEEVNQTLSSSIPSPMQPLADPTAGRFNQTDSISRKN